jgi:hypothetical protein
MSLFSRQRIRPLLASVAFLALCSMPLAVLAGPNGTEIQAANLARMEAERLNGGLSKYFTANCMHQKGGGECLISTSAQGYLFRFFGGDPGWEVNKQAATVETELLVAPDAKSIQRVFYNGKPRSAP